MYRFNSLGFRPAALLLLVVWNLIVPGQAAARTGCTRPDTCHT